MPQPANGTTTFEEFLTRAAATIPDADQRAGFTSTFSGILQQVPDETKKALDNGILLHRDYARLVNEHRQASTALQQREADLQQRLQRTVDPNQHSALLGQLQTLQAEVQQLRDKAQGFDVIRERLDAQNLTDLVQEDDDIFWQTKTTLSQGQGASIVSNPAQPQPQFNNTVNGIQQIDPNAPVLYNGQWYVPTPQGLVPVIAAPALGQPQAPIFNTQNPFAPAAPANDFMTREDFGKAIQETFLPMLAQGFSASTQAAQEVQMFCTEIQTLNGQTLDPRQVNAAWQQSGKQFDQFLEDTYKLSELRAAKSKTDYAADVAKAAQQLFDQKFSAMAASGTLHPGAPPTTSPLFDAIKARPDGLRQAPTAGVTHVPGAPSHQQAPPDPNTNPANTPAAPNPAQPQLTPAPPAAPIISGAEAAARALASRTHVGERWDITRPAG